MFNHERYLRLIIIIGFFAAVIQYFIYGVDDLNKIFKIISTSMTVSLFVHVLFNKYLWKLKIFRPIIVKVPNLQGLWEGKILPISNDNNDRDVKLYIKQSFSSISVEVQTINMTSQSYLAGFCVSEEFDNIELCYLYTSKSKLEQRVENPWHEGSCKLKVFEGATISLEGEYWTSRKTIGKINVKRVSLDPKRHN